MYEQKFYVRKTEYLKWTYLRLKALECTVPIFIARIKLNLKIYFKNQKGKYFM